MKAWWTALRMRLRLLNRRRLRRRARQQGRSYEEWVDSYDRLGPAQLEALAARLRRLPSTPVIALLMPVHNPPAAWLEQTIAGVRAQIYPHWELCIADDASTDPAVAAVLERAAAAEPRIRVHRRERNGHIVAASNDALALVRAPYVALLDHDDLLREHALLLVAEALNRWPQAQLVYSDEDKLRIDGERSDPYFKPDWNPELLLSQNYLRHLSTYATRRVREVGGFRAGTEGAQDHDLALRFTEGLAADAIVHIPHVLYHWRQHDASTAGRTCAKPYAQAAAERAVRDHLARVDMAAEVSSDELGWLRVDAQAPHPEPSVTLIVPTRDGVRTLGRCVASLLERTRYANWSLVIVDNGSTDERFLAQLRALAENPRIEVLRDDRAFNFSALNNAAAARASGEFIVLLNDDTEVLAPDWLGQLVAWGCRPGVGSVGARLWYPDMTLQHAGLVTGIGSVAGHAHRHLRQGEPGQRGRAMLLQDFSALTAACLLVRRELYLELGGLDEEQFSVAFNDVDFCLRLRQRGLRNVWVPGAELIHHESVSRGSDRERRNRERAAREIDAMVARWGPALRNDPAYNPNLTLDADDFGLAFPPRVDLLRPWFEGGAADNR